MNEKKSILDLAEPISEATGLPKKLVDSFVRSLMDIIDESLQKDGIAKVKNLGTFKVIDIEERKSVNVQNGSEVIIPAHKKVTFTPDKILKDEINKPYAHLETYVLKDDGPVDGPFIDEENEEDVLDESVDVVASDNTVAVVSSASEPEKVVDDTVVEVAVPSTVEVPEEISDATESEAETKSEEESATPTGWETSSESTSDVSDELPSESSSEAPIEEASSSEAENGLDNDSIIQEKDLDMENEKETKVENDSTVPMNETKEGNTPKEDTPEETQKDKKAGSKWWLWLLLAVALIIALLFGARYYLDHKDKGDQFNTEPTLGQVTNGDDIEVGESDPFFDEEEPSQGDEFERAMAGESIDTSIPEETTTTETAEVSEPAESEPVASNAELVAFDSKLVNYMKKNHPEMNFPEKVAVLKEYEVLPGSRMAQVSRNLYDGTFNYWVYLYFYNTDVLKTPDNVKPGMILKVPDLGSEFVDPKSAKCKALATEIQNALLK